MVSIICVTYNMANYLKQCINSILNQTYKDIEIIVVNDGSADNTAEILNDFQPYITVIEQENKGHSEARNVGMTNAKGDCLYFIDADDYIHPETIEILMSNLLEYDADISIGNYTRKDNLPQKLVNNRKVYNTMESLDILIRNSIPFDKRKLSFTATWNKIFKKELFNNVKFPTGHIHDDNFTAHRLLFNAKKVVYTTAVTYFYTYKEHSMSSDGIYKNRDMILAYEDRIKFFEENNLNDLLRVTKSYHKHVCEMTYKRTHDYSIIEEYNLNIKKVIIFVRDAQAQNGILTWVDNLTKQFDGKFHFQVICEKGRRYEKYSKEKEYKCHTFIYNYDMNELPTNIMAEKTYIVLHCDYGSNPNNLTFDRNYNYIAVSNVVAEGMKKKYDIDCQTIEGIFIQKPKRKKVYKFLTAAQPIKTKGIEKIFKFIKLLKENDICFQWYLYFDKVWLTSMFKSNIPELIVCNSIPNDLLMQYMQEVDYVIQLSEREGFCLTVHESLMMGTPVLVTDIPIFSFVQDGYNGYKLPLDMENIDLNKILNNIPKEFEYDNDYNNLYNKLRKILD